MSRQPISRRTASISDEAPDEGMLVVSLAVASHAVLAHAASLRVSATCAVAALFAAGLLLNAQRSVADMG
jgi:hypothetical protein